MVTGRQGTGAGGHVAESGGHVASAQTASAAAPALELVAWPRRTVSTGPGAVIFDLDGTLVDTVPLRVAGWIATFAEFGLRVEPEWLHLLMGADGHLVAREGARMAGRAIDDEMAERIDHRSGEHFNRLNETPRPLPGAADLLRDLASAGVPHAIATASRAGQVLASVDALGLPSRPMIVDGSHVRHAKPAPDLLLLAARRLRVAPSACWYVGDSIWDMQAARAAGMVAAGVTTGFAAAADLQRAGADLVAADLVDLRGRIAGHVPTRRGRLVHTV